MTIRLHLAEPIEAGADTSISTDQAHYLRGVMRQAIGDRLRVFDGRSGEWEAEIAELGKRGGTLRILQRTAPQRDPPDVWLLFAPIKKARTDFIVEKAAEMGATRICPVQTDFTNSERIRRDRLQAHAIEAAEQCGGTFVPEVTELRKLSAVIDSWDPNRQIMFCDETLAESGAALPGVLANGDMPWAILIGPEGGFSEPERGRLASLNFAHAVSLGPRILRADTAAVAAMTLWQTAFGDWR